MQNKSFFSQLLARLTTETPIFFKKILYFGITLGAIGGAILGIDATHLAKLPLVLTDLSGYMVTAGVVCAAVAKVTTTNPDLQAQGGSNPVVNAKQDPPVSTEAVKSPPLE